MKYLFAILGLAVAGVAALYFLTRKKTPAPAAAAAAPPPTYTGNKDAQTIQAVGGAVASIAGAAGALFGALGSFGSPAPGAANSIGF